METQPAESQAKTKSGAGVSFFFSKVLGVCGVMEARSSQAAAAEASGVGSGLHFRSTGLDGSGQHLNVFQVGKQPCNTRQGNEPISFLSCLARQMQLQPQRARNGPQFAASPAVCDLKGRRRKCEDLRSLAEARLTSSTAACLPDSLRDATPQSGRAKIVCPAEAQGWTWITVDLPQPRPRWHLMRRDVGTPLRVSMISQPHPQP